MSLRMKIVEWAKSQPLFNKELLFRVIKNNDFSDQDVSDLCNLIKKEVGLITDVEFKFTSDFESLSSTVDDGTQIVKLKNIQGFKEVNTLRNDMLVPFFHNGLTIVYGENGAGKSGIARVIKSACSARVRGAVLPNIYSDDFSVVPSATIEYFLNDEVHTHNWKADVPPELVLSNVHVFDSKTAEVQINNKNEVSFIPAGGHIFEIAINAIKLVKERLNEEVERYLVPDIISAKSMGNIQDDVLSFYLNIKKNTDIESTRDLLVWSEDDEKSLTELEGELKIADVENNQKMSLEVTKCIGVFNDVSTFFKTCDQVFSTEKLVNLEKTISDFNSKSSALDILGREINSLNVLDGVGGSFWREMYEAARKYSENVAYKEKKFPLVSPDSKCVLCNQDLDDSSIKRFSSFEKIMNDQIKKDYDDIAKRIEQIFEYIRNKIINSKEVIESKLELLKEYITEEENKLVLDNLGDIVSKAIALELCLKEKKSGFNDIKPDLMIDEDFLSRINSRILKRSKELKDILDPKKISELKSQILKLKLRKEVFSQKDSFLDIVRINKKNSLIEKGSTLLNSSSISRASNSLISNIIKESFLDTLKKEAKYLGASHIPVSLNTSGGDGKVYFDIVFEKGRLPKKSKVSDILSEGEQKIISMSAFLAEVSISESKHAIVFDDPVTSLDHKFKEKIARRLVEESLNRQVIIFTHDISLLTLLKDIGVELSAVGGPIYIHRPAGKGEVNHISPWDTMNIEDMIKHLKIKANDLSSLVQESANHYNEAAGEIYGLMRESWEKLVESVLLNGTVSRFSYDVKTQSLAGVKIDDSDFKKVYFGMKKCSRWMIGHKDSEAVSSKRPDVSEIQSDIKDFEAFWSDKNKIRKSTDKDRKNSILAMPKPELG